MSETGTKRKRTSKLATSEIETTRPDPALGQDADVSREAIARRAYEIAHSDQAGTAEQNWLRAEQELRGSTNAGG